MTFFKQNWRNWIMVEAFHRKRRGDVRRGNEEARLRPAHRGPSAQAQPEGRRGDSASSRPRLFASIEILGVFFLALMPRVLRLGTFWGTDERYHWELSNQFFLALLNRDWANTVPQGLPGLTLAWIDSIAMILKYAWTWLISSGSASLEQIMAPDRPFVLLAERQLPVVLVNSLLVGGIFSLAAQILGRKAAWVGLIFVSLDPFLLAESRVLRFEALVTGLMLMSFLVSLVYLKEQFSGPAEGGLRSGRWLVLSAALTALAMLTKISATLLLPTIAVLGLATILSVKLANQQISESANHSWQADHSLSRFSASSLLRPFAIHHSPFSFTSLPPPELESPLHHGQDRLHPV